MEHIQQITKTVTLNLPAVSNGGNKEKVEKTPVVFQQSDKAPVNAVVNNEVEQKEEDKEQKEVEVKEADRERKEEEVKEADRIISVVNNKLKIVSDDRSRTGMVVKILDKESGDLVKQIPSEEVLNIMARLKESGVGAIVDDNA